MDAIFPYPDVRLYFLQPVATHLGPVGAKIKVAGFDIPQPCAQPGPGQGLGVAHFGFPQGLFGPLLPGNVGERYAHHWRCIAFFSVLANEMRYKGGAIGAEKSQFTTLFFAMLLCMKTMVMPTASISRIDIFCKTTIDQFLALYTQNCAASLISFYNDPVLGKSKIANRGEIIKLHIAVMGCLQRGISASQLLVLHLQFDLVCAKFVQMFVSQ